VAAQRAARRAARIELLADELVEPLRGFGRPVIRASIVIVNPLRPIWWTSDEPVARGG
jgi:hypothetical protein